MNYGPQDLKNSTEVTIPGHRADHMAHWARCHDSNGTFHYKKILHKNCIVWQFEKAEDAVLFALLFK